LSKLFVLVVSLLCGLLSFFIDHWRIYICSDVMQLCGALEKIMRNKGRATRYVVDFIWRGRATRSVVDAWIDMFLVGFELRDNLCVSLGQTCITSFDSYSLWLMNCYRGYWIVKDCDDLTMYSVYWGTSCDILFALSCIWVRTVRLGWLSIVGCSCRGSIGVVGVVGVLVFSIALLQDI